MGGVAHRRSVARPMPGRAHAEEIAKSRDLAGHADAADLREMAANEINQTPADNIDVFIRIIEQLAHRNWRRALLPKNFEVTDIFGREGIFHEIWAILFQLLAKADRVDGRQ